MSTARCGKAIAYPRPLRDQGLGLRNAQHLKGRALQQRADPRATDSAGGEAGKDQYADGEQEEFRALTQSAKLPSNA